MKIESFYTPDDETTWIIKVDTIDGEPKSVQWGVFTDRAKVDALFALVCPGHEIQYSTAKTTAFGMAREASVKPRPPIQSADQAALLSYMAMLDLIPDGMVYLGTGTCVDKAELRRAVQARLDDISRAKAKRIEGLH